MKRISREERLAAAARRLAALVMTADDSVTAPPILLNDPRLAIARQFWSNHAVRLAALGTLDDLSRINLALLAVYVGDFVMAENDILDNGFSVRVKTISGDRMPRENPAVARRDHATKMILDLGRHFGLSKLDRLNLQRLRRNALGSPGLFEEGGQGNPAGTSAEADADGDDARAWRELWVPTSGEPN
jgi:phage terminase small subunit